MQDPVILVTGSTDRIGKATARELAAHGAEVILHGRNQGKGQEVIRDLKRQVWNRKLDLVIADFCVLDKDPGTRQDGTLCPELVLAVPRGTGIGY
jgi:NAD(P)-dependent dehydrogenase (short-subunit alcohol dehydrogenase family)